MSNFINTALRNFGMEIKPFPNSELSKRIKLFKHFEIDLVLDVGASIGEYGKAIRRIGYRNRIISFEPIKRSFQSLKLNSNSDNLWDTFNYALGKEDKKSVINISRNSDSSSILQISDLHTSTNSESAFVSTEEIEIKRLDTVFPSLNKDEKNIFLKIDTQGYEKEVLKGAGDLLESMIKGIQIELSIVPLYSGSADYISIINYLKQFKFELFGLEPGFYDKKSGRLLQFDGIFFKD